MLEPYNQYLMVQGTEKEYSPSSASNNPAKQINRITKSKPPFLYIVTENTPYHVLKLGLLQSRHIKSFVKCRTRSEV